MEFFLHYITADIKYNFWSNEDGHQFREDWVKCRINVKYFDSPNIQISCYPVKHCETIPLGIDINFADFHFERVEEVFGTKPNVFALLWTHQNQTNEFHIAIDDAIQFSNYEVYLKNLMKICRIAEIERLDLQPIEASSISSRHIDASSLSLLATSAYDTPEDRNIAIEPITMKKIAAAKPRFGLSRVRNATKCAAKKFNRIISMAKFKLIKPSTKYSGDTSILSSSTQMTDMDLSYESEEVDLNDISRFSSRSTVRLDDSHQAHTANYRLSNDSFNSTMTSSTRFEQSLSSNDVSLNGSSLMQQIFAESIADLNMICGETPTLKLVETKKIIRKGTPYKLKMPSRLTLYEEDLWPSEFSENDSFEVISQSDIESDAVDAIEMETVEREPIGNRFESPPKARFKSHFDPVTPKISIAKRIARAYRDLCSFLSNPKYDIEPDYPIAYHNIYAYNVPFTQF